MSKEKTIGCLLAFALLCGAYSRGATEEGVRFKLIRESIITVPVLVNGRGPFDFVFDTGSQSSLIDSALAEELNIRPVDRIVELNPLGEKVFARGFADEVSIGSARVLHSEVVMGKLDGLHAANPRIRGIIGQNVLSHFDYLIDYAHSMIQFLSGTNSEEPIPGMKTKVFRLNGCPVLTAHPTAGSDIRLVLDSGSSDLVLYSARISNFVPSALGHLQATNVSEETATGVISRIDIGNVALRELRAAIVGNSRVSEVDGLMPTRVFRSVYVNNSEGYVILRPR